MTAPSASDLPLDAAPADPPPDRRGITPPGGRASSEARRAVAVLVSGMALIGLGLGLFAWWLGPPSGDLARIDGRSERLYGWRGTVEAHPDADAARIGADALAAGAGEGALLIFGDSFAAPDRYRAGWSETLAAMTDAPVRTVSIADFRSALAWLESDDARRRPPRAVVVQSVERNTAARALDLYDPNGPCPAPAEPRTASLAVAPPSGGRPRSRHARFAGFDALMARGALGVRVRLIGPTQSVRLVALGPGPDGTVARFSSVVQDRLLILGADVDHQTARVYRDVPADVAARRIGCGLRRIAAAAEAAGLPFLFVIAPDKRSVYEPWMAPPPPPPHVDLFAAATAALGRLHLDLRAPLREAVAAGAVDVHRPDDTHWGTEGARLAATATLRRLTGADPASED